MKTTLCSLLLTLATMLVAQAEVVLDQEHNFTSGVANTTNGDVSEPGQTFAIGIAGTLDHVDVLMFRLGGIFDPTGDPRFSIYNTAGGLPIGPPLATVVIAEGLVPLNAAAFVTFDVSGAGIPVAVGDQLAFGITATNGIGPYFLLTDGDIGAVDDYAAGDAVSRLTGGSTWQFFNPAQDHGFRTFVNAPSILLGDINLDGTVNLLDISPFVKLVTTGTLQAEADINQDGQVNLLDVSPFVELLGGG